MTIRTQNGESRLVTAGSFVSDSRVQVSITHPGVGTAIAVTGTSDPNLVPDTGYVQVTNHYTESTKWGDGFTVNADGTITVNKSGRLTGWGYLDPKHSANNSTVGVVFGFTRSAVLSLTPRAVHTKMPNAGDVGNISGLGLVGAPVQAGDIMSVHIASDITGTIDIESSSIVFELQTEVI